MLPYQHAPTFRYTDCVQCGQVVRAQKVPPEATAAAGANCIGYVAECPSCRVQVHMLFQPPSPILKPTKG